MPKRVDFHMFSGTTFEWIDQSQIQQIPVPDPVKIPHMLVASSFDKGPEKYVTIKGKDFFKYYGSDFSKAFEKHGQCAIQAAHAINAGAKLTVRRVCAPDAALANIAVFATLRKTTVQKTDADGNPLYTDSTTGEETTVETGNTPINETGLEIEYTTKTQAQGDNDADGNLIINNIDNLADIFYGQGTFDDDTASIDSADGLVFPLFLITDIGRGASAKRFRFSTDYNTSRTQDFMRYNFEIIENNELIESISLSLHPESRYVTTNMALMPRIRKNSFQVDCRSFDNAIRALFETVAKELDVDLDTANSYDLFFARTKKGTETIPIKITGTSMANPYGIALESGDNGCFGDKPINAPEYVNEMCKVFNGDYSKEIYDLDNFMINLVVDANYDPKIKRAIEDLVIFREDCFYIRDLGLNLKSMDEIINAHRDCTKSFFCGTYHNSYDIIDEFSKKQITVTICYDLAAILVDHFANGRFRPLAGFRHGFTFPNAIEGTINFIPAIIPGLNQKEILMNERINYTNYYNGLLTMETLYTSSDDYSQLSFINNVIGTQEVIQAVRAKCPKIRYAFLDGDDLEKYQEDVNAVLNQFQSNFAELSMEYIADEVMVANKVYYAAIYVRYRDFVQAEYFKLFALPSQSGASVIS